MANVAGYVMALRQGKGMSRARLAEAVGSTEMSILRIEKQGQEPSGQLLVRLIDTLGGSWEVVTRLLKSDEDDALEQVLAEVQEATRTDQGAADRFNRYLELVASGVPSDDAARRVLHG